MKIRFLGTSAGWPLPRLGCNCEICKSPNPRNRRLRPTLLVNDSILIDASPDIYHQLYKSQNTNHKTQITHIFLTHTHPDHVMGLYDLSHLYGQEEKPTIVAPEGLLSKIRILFGYPIGGSFRTQIVKPQEEINFAGIHAWYIPVEHGNIEAYGIKLKERKIVFYAPEFRKILPSARKDIRGIELLILDGSSLTSSGQTKGHESIEEGVRLAKDLRPKRILFTNIGHKTLPHDKLSSWVKEKGGENFDIAYDSLEIEL